MSSTNNGISGVAVGILAAGVLFIWSGIENQTLITSLRFLAMGKEIPSGSQTKGTHSAGAQPRNPGAPLPHGSIGTGNSNVVAIAASYKGRPYLFGGGHRTVCPDGPMDCSGYVSCVLNRAGLMEGTLTTDGFKSWGVSVPWEQRQPGDIVVWVGGAGNGHMGIIATADTMWHSPCTKCSGVQLGKYGKSRTGRPTIVRRARNG